MVTVVLLGAGSGKRFGTVLPKQFQKIFGKTILQHSAERILSCSRVDSLVYVAKAGEEGSMDSFLASSGCHHVVTTGGVQRAHSVLNGLRSCNPSTEIVLIHDGARPNLSSDLMNRLIESVENFSMGAVPVLPVTDTLKKRDGEWISSTIDREELVRVQTPQAYPYKMILEAYEFGLRKGFIGTDDAAYIQRMGGMVRGVEGEAWNLKITTPEDLDLFHFYLKKSGYEDR